MKKLFIAVLLILAVSLFVPVIASASTSNADISNLVNSHDNVKSSQVVVYEDKCLVAIRPVGVISKQQSLQLRQTLEESIKENNSDIKEVFVTMHAKAYKEIEKINKMSEPERTETIVKYYEMLQKHMEKRGTNLDDMKKLVG